MCVCVLLRGNACSDSRGRSSLPRPKQPVPRGGATQKPNFHKSKCSRMMLHIRIRRSIGKAASLQTSNSSRSASALRIRLPSMAASVGAAAPLYLAGNGLSQNGHDSKNGGYHYYATPSVVVDVFVVDCRFVFFYVTLPRI